MSTSHPPRDWKSQFYDSAFANPSPDPLRELRTVQNTRVLGSSKNLSIKSLKASCQAIVKLSQEGSTYYSSIRSQSSVSGSFTRQPPELTPQDKVATWVTEPPTYERDDTPLPALSQPDITSVQTSASPTKSSFPPRLPTSQNRSHSPPGPVQPRAREPAPSWAPAPVPSPSGEHEPLPHTRSSSLQHTTVSSATTLADQTQLDSYDNKTVPREPDDYPIKCRGRGNDNTTRRPFSSKCEDEAASRLPHTDTSMTRQPHLESSTTRQPYSEAPRHPHADLLSHASDPKLASPNYPPNSFSQGAAPPRRPRKARHSDSPQAIRTGGVVQTREAVVHPAIHAPVHQPGHISEECSTGELGDLNEEDNIIIEDLKELEQQVNRVNIYIKNVPNLPITKNDMNTKLLEYVKNVYELLHDTHKIIASIDREGSQQFYKKYNGFVLDYSKSKVPLIVVIIE